MKVLFAADGSPGSGKALEALLALGARLREPLQVELLFVHPPVPIGLATAHVSRELLDGYYRDEGEAALAPARAALDAAGVSYTAHVRVGEPADVIVRQAHALDCALICLGRRGQGAFADWMLGSVAAKVLNLADLPVLSAT